MFVALLDAGRPQGNLLHKLHSTLVNSQDVGQAMSEAVQHVATWFNRVSKVANGTSAAAVGNAGDDALKDGRLPDLLKDAGKRSGLSGACRFAGSTYGSHFDRGWHAARFR